MPERPTAIPGVPCWVDLLTSDRGRSVDFYGQVFGWSAEEPNEQFGGYLNFRKGDVRVAGCMAQMSDSTVPDVWSVYLASEDAVKTVESATASGGSALVPAMPVGDLGVMALLSDVTGAGVGVWQPGRHQGFGLVAEPGAPAWFELHTGDYAAALDFYRAVFGWQTRIVSDTDEFRYSVMVDGEDWHAGVMDDSAALAGPGGSSYWSVYFGVADTDDTLTVIQKLGGTVLMPAEDTPYGRIAAVADPTGARFNLVAANAAMPAHGEGS